MLGALIGAGASLLGGFMGSKSQEKAAAKQAELQKEFAQSGIQWKVADAKKAGISPLYALGANTTSYQPTSVGGDPLSESLSQSGQQIGRAIDATRSNSAKAEALATTAAQAQIDGIRLDNDIKRATLASAITRNNPTGLAPGMPTDLSQPAMAGQGNDTNIKITKDLVPAAGPDRHADEYGIQPEKSWYRSETGYVPQIPQQLGDAMEGEPFNLSGAQWFLRNKVAPSLMNSYFKPPFKAPAGKEWQFNPIFGQYELVTDRRRRSISPWIYHQ